MFRQKLYVGSVAAQASINYDPPPYQPGLNTIFVKEYKQVPSTIVSDESFKGLNPNALLAAFSGLNASYNSLGRLNAKIVLQTTMKNRVIITPERPGGKYSYIITISLNGLSDTNPIKGFTTSIYFTYSWEDTRRYLLNQKLETNREGRTLLSYSEDSYLDNYPNQDIDLIYILFPGTSRISFNMQVKVVISYRGSLFIQLFYNFVLGLKTVVSSSTPRQLLSWSNDQCPTIQIKCMDDLWYGNDLAQSVFQSTGEKTISRYFGDFTKYVITLPGSDGCTLAGKVMAIVQRDFQPNESDQVLGQIVTYGLAKIYLWHLVTGQAMTTKILPRVYNRIFFGTLAASPRYSCCAEIFQAPELVAVQDYFVLLPPE